MARATLVVVAAVVLIARLSQLDLLWIEESYPMAAVAQMMHGKFLYRDIWFDKPPLYAVVYLLWGAVPGWSLRLAGALYSLLASALLYGFARERWGRREALIAGCLLAIYLTFGIPSAVMALAPDLLTVAPHIAAVWLAWKGRAFWAGGAAGVAFLCNPKGAFVLAACFIWAWRSWLPLLLGFALPNLVFLGVLAANGALRDYWQQVWIWGAVYTRDTLFSNPSLEGLKRTVNWAGFQAAAVAGALCCLWREPDRKMLAWVLIALIGVVAGFRFFPRYYFLLLPPVVLLGARGIATMRRPAAVGVLALALIPIVRFGPRYVQLLRGDRQWSDLAMMQDSRVAAKELKRAASPGADLLVWGYRPDIFVFSGLPAATRFLDSQPLNGVIADRHLGDARASAPEIAAANRKQIQGVAPAFIVDGLGPYNPALSVDHYLDLRGYRCIARNKGSVVYQREDPAR
jgi:4-amino-4-deoxy-L-arabinose transferase-like glycosyltransferase